MHSPLAVYKRRRHSLRRVTTHIVPCRALMHDGTGGAAPFTSRVARGAKGGPQQISQKGEPCRCPLPCLRNTGLMISVRVRFSPPPPPRIFQGARYPGICL